MIIYSKAPSVKVTYVIIMFDKVCLKCLPLKHRISTSINVWQFTKKCSGYSCLVVQVLKNAIYCAPATELQLVAVQLYLDF